MRKKDDFVIKEDLENIAEIKYTNIFFENLMEFGSVKNNLYITRHNQEINVYQNKFPTEYVFEDNKELRKESKEKIEKFYNCKKYKKTFYFYVDKPYKKDSSVCRITSIDIFLYILNSQNCDYLFSILRGETNTNLFYDRGYAILKVTLLMDNPIDFIKSLKTIKEKCKKNFILFTKRPKILYIDFFYQDIKKYIKVGKSENFREHIINSNFIPVLSNKSNMTFAFLNNLAKIWENENVFYIFDEIDGNVDSKQISLKRSDFNDFNVLYFKIFKSKSKRKNININNLSDVEIKKLFNFLCNLNLDRKIIINNNTLEFKDMVNLKNNFKDIKFITNANSKINFSNDIDKYIILSSEDTLSDIENSLKKIKYDTIPITFDVRRFCQERLTFNALKVGRIHYYDPIFEEIGLIEKSDDIKFSQILDKIYAENIKAFINQSDKEIIWVVHRDNYLNDICIPFENI